MPTRPPLLIAGALLLLPACGHKGDPLPPLRRTPPALTAFRLAQRGDALELQATAPAASVDGVVYDTSGVEFLYGTGQADIEKAGRRLPVRVAPGARATTTLPLPAPGTLVRAAARGIERGERGPRSLTMALVAQPPLEPPRELTAALAEGGVELGWKGARPKEVAPPVGPKPSAVPGAVPGKPVVPGAAPVPGATAAPSAPAAPAAAEPPAARPPAESAPAESAPALPSETKPEQTTPGETKPGETKPGETKAEQAKPAGTKPGEVTTVQAPPPRRSGFYVYRRAKSGAYAGPLGAEPLDRRTFRDEGAGLGTTWCYVVRAVASSEPLIESAPSNEACLERRDITPPAAPVGLAVLPRPGGLELLWSPSAEEDLAGYRVYRAVEGQAPQRLAELGPSKAAYLDESAVKGAVYRYTLTAFDQSGNESPPSDAAEATVP